MLDVLWVTISAGLVFLMQAGFLCLEAGLTRSKNNISVAMKNIIDVGISMILFWLLGYGLLFGASFGGLIGTNFFALDFAQQPYWNSSFFLFQAVFCSTSVTILSGAVAERIHFNGYIISAGLVAGLIYPIFGHWVWNGADLGMAQGWLGQRGFIDFAGSTVVHSVGGWVSLAAVLIVGARTGRFPPNGPAQRIPGSNLPLSMIGVLLLWIGWIGFNGGSTMAMNDRVPMIIANTMLGGAAGLVATLFVGWNIRKRIDPDLVINGSLAGLVAITAGCFAISSSAAIIIGAVGGLVMLACDWLLDRLQIDDAVGAIPVHLAAGIWGTIAVGIFGQPDLLGTGLSQMQQIAVQLEGVLICTVWTFGLAYSALFLVNKVVPLRVSLLQEQVGMNITEHSTSSELMDLLTVMDHQAHTGDLKQRAPVEPFTEVGQIAMHYNHVLEALDQAIARTRSIVQASQDAIITFSHDTQTIISLNPAAERMFGYQELELQGKNIKHLLYPDQQHSTSNIDDSLFDGEIHEFQTYRRNGNTLATELVLSRTSDQTALSILTLRDISERKRIELARSQLHEEIIKAQAATLAELSAPMIPLNKSALVMPLIGAMNTQRAQSIFETLLHGVERQGAKVVLLDVTGVQSMDTQVAHVLIQAAKAVRMLGARVVLTGISPEVARSLVGLSIDQRGITTYNTLQDAIAATL